MLKLLGWPTVAMPPFNRPATIKRGLKPRKKLLQTSNTSNTRELSDAVQLLRVVCFLETDIYSCLDLLELTHA